MAAVEKKVGDQVGFEFYPAEQLGKLKDQLQLVTSGAVDIAQIDPGYTPDKLPLSEIGHLPGAYSKACDAALPYWEMISPGGSLDALEWKPQGIRAIIAYSFSQYQMFVNKAFHSLSDIKGFKLRVSGPAVYATVQGMGAVPVFVSGPETYQALSRGTVDGVIFSIASVKAYNLDRLVKAGTIDENFSGSTIGYAINENSWRKLPLAVQEAMHAASEETVRYACDDSPVANLVNKTGLPAAPFRTDNW